MDELDIVFQSLVWRHSVVASRQAWTRDIIFSFVKSFDEALEIGWVMPCTMDDQNRRRALRHDEFVEIMFNGICAGLMSDSSHGSANLSQLLQNILARDRWPELAQRGVYSDAVRDVVSCTAYGRGINQQAPEQWNRRTEVAP